MKKSSNPKIEELSKSHKERRINLSDLDPIVIDGKKRCIWCSNPLKGRQLKWCSQECSNHAFAWANPQQEGGLQILLVRQNWKCNICQYDYTPHVEETKRSMKNYYPEVVNFDFTEKFHMPFFRRLKNRIPFEKRLEVDHILPIYKGGQSIGFENHQAICYSCHKSKTSKDLSGKRKCPACSGTGNIHKNCILRQSSS